MSETAVEETFVGIDGGNVLRPVVVKEVVNVDSTARADDGMNTKEIRAESVMATINRGVTSVLHTLVFVW